MARPRQILIRREPEVIDLPEGAENWSDSQVWEYLDELDPYINEWADYDRV